MEFPSGDAVPELAMKRMEETLPDCWIKTVLPPADVAIGPVPDKNKVSETDRDPALVVKRKLAGPTLFDKVDGVWWLIMYPLRIQVFCDDDNSIGSIAAILT